jgi:hypothetical protein
VNLEKKVLHKAVEAEILDASARMTVEELLDGESEDYARGLQDGYSLCLELAGLLDSILRRKC